MQRRIFIFLLLDLHHGRQSWLCSLTRARLLNTVLVVGTCMLMHILLVNVQFLLHLLAYFLSFIFNLRDVLLDIETNRSASHDLLLQLFTLVVGRQIS